MARIEVYWDFPAAFENIAVLPLGAKHRFCLQDNGFYYGARSSENSLAAYERKSPAAAGLNAPWTHVEARIRAKVEPARLVDTCVPFFSRFGVYWTPYPFSMLHLPDAWRAADTRGRNRFLARIDPFRLRVDEQRVSSVIEAFAKLVVPPAFLG